MRKAVCFVSCRCADFCTSTGDVLGALFPVSYAARVAPAAAPTATAAAKNLLYYAGGGYNRPAARRPRARAPGRRRASGPSRRRPPAPRRPAGAPARSALARSSAARAPPLLPLRRRRGTPRPGRYPSPQPHEPAADDAAARNGRSRGGSGGGVCSEVALLIISCSMLCTRIHVTAAPTGDFKSTNRRSASTKSQTVGLDGFVVGMRLVVGPGECSATRATGSASMSW